MAYINVEEWGPENVAEWLRGLDDALLPYVHFFVNQRVDGYRLLLLASEDMEALHISKVGHQELILEAVQLLRHLHYELMSETLQSLFLQLSCKARNLYNELRMSNAAEVSTRTLSAVVDLLKTVKNLVAWMDRSPFEGCRDPFRQRVLQISVELALTAQRDKFADQPLAVIKSGCLHLADLADSLIQSPPDSLILQPASLDLTTIKKKSDEDLGLQMMTQYPGNHIVGGLKYQGPSHRSKKLDYGDEIVQVNYQTVVGWQHNKLLYAMNECSNQVLLTIKKRPHHAESGEVLLHKPYRVPLKKIEFVSSSSSSQQRNSGSTKEGEPGTKGRRGPMPRPRHLLQRRATVSGASPTVTKAPVSLDQLLDGLRRKEAVARSISHDPSATVAPSSISGGEARKRFAKQQHLTVADYKPPPSPTGPEESVGPTSIPIPPTSIPVPSRPPPPIPVDLPPPQLSPPTAARPEASTSSSKAPYQFTTFTSRASPDVSSPNSKTSCHEMSSPINKTAPHDIPSPSKTSSHESPTSNNKASQAIMQPEAAAAADEASDSQHLKLGRRISCKELGPGECEGWLARRKERCGILSHWIKRWTVLTDSCMYSYPNGESLKADSFVHLPGFTVATAPECKSRRFAFKLSHSGNQIYFAAECQEDLDKWIAKLSYAASSSTENPYFSETEDESENGSPVKSRSNIPVLHDRPPCLEPYPKSQALTGLFPTRRFLQKLGSPRLERRIMSKQMRKAACRTTGSQTEYSGADCPAQPYMGVAMLGKRRATETKVEGPAGEEDVAGMAARLWRAGLAPDGTDLRARRLTAMSRQRVNQRTLTMMAAHRTLRDRLKELAAIDQLLSSPRGVNSRTLEQWAFRYPHYLPSDYC